VDSAVSDAFQVQSHRGPYEVEFDDAGLARLGAEPPPGAHFVVDARVAELYEHDLGAVLAEPSTLLIEASEPAKSLDRFPAYIEHLVGNGVKRGNVLVAVGGGVIQDIVCFLAATLMRGLEWRFHPTTLLAQADSCIGSKSSINVGEIKNILGTFTPPSQVTIAVPVLRTLSDEEIRSGIGEMLKVHAIHGPESFDRIAADYRSILTDDSVLRRYIRASLEYKRELIELDEFDRGPRNVMNYGHSFGHAIESATDFGIPHGIAVTIGMDMANYVAARLGHGSGDHYERMHPALAANYEGFESYPISADALLAAIAKDKKNTARGLRLILPDAERRIRIVEQPADDAFRAACADYLAGER
jgi:3-dehydroquinate synthase